jgi:antitoxin VapB
MKTTIFMNGRSQAVRLPKMYRLPGTKARIHKEGKNVILEPIENDWIDLLESLKTFSPDFMEHARNQPLPQKRGCW